MRTVIPTGHHTNGQDFSVGQKVFVAGRDWSDEPGVIEQLETYTYYALVLRNGGRSASWLPLASLTVAK